MLPLESDQSFDDIVNLSEQLNSLISNRDITELEKKIPEYTEKIESLFLKQQNQKLIPTDMDKLEQLILTHKKITHLLDVDKTKISKSIKQLHVGRKMQNTYP